MPATRKLPNGFIAVWFVDLTRSKSLVFGLNLIALPLLLFFGLLFYRLISEIRPGIDLFDLFSFNTVWRVLMLTGSYILVIFLHEICHGIFFRLITGSTPIYRFRWYYAFAAAPDFFIRRNPYLLIGLAPLVVISAAGLSLASLLSTDLVFLVWFALTVNAAGSVGDLYITGRLVTSHPPHALVQDEGDKFTVFQLVPSNQE